MSGSGEGIGLRLYRPESGGLDRPPATERRGPGVSAYMIDGAVVHVLTWLFRPSDPDARFVPETRTWVALRLA